MAAAQLALMRCREMHDITRALSFHRSTNHADTFAETLVDTARRIPGADHAQGLWAASVHHRQTPTQRNDTLDRFARHPLAPTPRRTALAVLANVRIAAEGVDIPLVDSVLFADPRTSTIGIVQAVGRALRLPPASTSAPPLSSPSSSDPESAPRTPLSAPPTTCCGRS